MLARSAMRLSRLGLTCAVVGVVAYLFPGPPRPSALNPLDRLDPRHISGELLPTDPPRELVGVLGPPGRPREPICCAALSPDGAWLVVGTGGGTVRLFEAPSLKQKWDCVAHAGRVGAVVFAPDGQSLASGGIDGGVRQWSVDGSPLPEARPGLAVEGPVLALAYSPDGRRLAVGSKGLVRLWGLGTASEAAIDLHDLSGRVNALAFSPDGRRLAGSDQAIQVWRLDGGRPEPASVLPGGDPWLRTLEFSPDGTALACLDTFGHGTVWGADDPPVSSWRVLGPLILKGAFAADGRHVLRVNGDGTLWVLRLRGRWWDA